MKNMSQVLLTQKCFFFLTNCSHYFIPWISNSADLYKRYCFLSLWVLFFFKKNDSLIGLMNPYHNNFNKCVKKKKGRITFYSVLFNSCISLSCNFRVTVRFCSYFVMMLKFVTFFIKFWVTQCLLVHIPVLSLWEVGLGDWRRIRRENFQNGVSQYSVQRKCMLNTMVMSQLTNHIYIYIYSVWGPMGVFLLRFSPMEDETWSWKEKKYWSGNLYQYIGFYFGFGCTCQSISRICTFSFSKQKE